MKEVFILGLIIWISLLLLVYILRKYINQGGDRAGCLSKRFRNK
jgi:hypothetical protein